MASLLPRAEGADEAVIGGQWQGMRDIRATLEKIVSETTRNEVLEDALLTVSRPVAQEMGEALYGKITRITGETGASIDAGPSDEEEQGSVGIKIGPRTKGSRASRTSAGFKVKFWEFGTSKLAARPFMRPTWDARARTLPEAFVRAIRPAYERAVAKFAKEAAR